MDSRGSRPPATPVKMTVRQPNRSASKEVTSAALTLPMPEPASTTSYPSIVPVSKTVCAAASLWASARAVRRCASSCGIAQISPMGTPKCASPLAVEQRHLMRVVAVACRRPLGHRRLDGGELLIRQEYVVGDQRLGQPLAGAGA